MCSEIISTEIDQSIPTSRYSNRYVRTCRYDRDSSRLLSFFRGYKIQIEISPLAPGEVYRFRIKVSNEEEISDWSEVLTTATKGKQILYGYF